MYLVNGIGWAVAFFVVRILPTPYLFYKMVYSSYERYSHLEFRVAICTMPIPFMLNSFWFYLLFTGVMKFIRKKGPVD